MLTLREASLHGGTQRRHRTAILVDVFPRDGLLHHLLDFLLDRRQQARLVLVVRYHAVDAVSRGEVGMCEHLYASRARLVVWGRHADRHPWGNRTCVFFRGAPATPTAPTTLKTRSIRRRASCYEECAHSVRRFSCVISRKRAAACFVI